MSQPESTTDRSDRVADTEVTAGADPESDPDSESETESGFLAAIEFLTGPDPNLGSFLLVVGVVTCVFIALFQFTLPPPISYLLTAGVIFVTVLSAIFASLLDSLGYFTRTTATVTESGGGPGRKPWVPVGKASAPLPPLINFDTELRAYAEMFDGGLPPEFDAFVSDYLRLKTNTENRPTIASDLRADLNPIGTLFADGSDGDRLYEDISRRLFRYITNTRGHVSLRRFAFYDDDGTEIDVRALRNELGHVELAVSNEGEAAEVDVVVQLYDVSGTVVGSRTCKAGVVSPGATKTLDTDVFVPADAQRAGTTIRVSEPGRIAANA
jgi:hypothetical protein